MKPRLKKLPQQVIVITGASSGLGLVTARKAARAGARVMLIARNAAALQQITAALRAEGHDVDHQVADVADREQLATAAAATVRRFGAIDTWVNNAGVSIYGRLDVVSAEDQRRLFETNYWGVVNGSLIALDHMRERGGAIINLGSELSELAVPLLGAYAASKHAVKGFTDALRIEIAQAHLPIAVTLIKPAGMDTLFVQHAKNYLDFQPKLPQPVYAPDIGADAILSAAQRPVRDIYVGGASKVTVLAARLAPGWVDFVLGKVGTGMQKSGRLPTDRAHHALAAPGGMAGYERSGLNGHVVESCAFTRLSARPRAGWYVLGAAAVGIALATIASRRRDPL